MQLIDDDGNLFGAVNVIDALAVLLILAVVVAGIAVVGVLGADGEPETRHATIDLGTQPDFVVDRVEAGDEMPVDGFSHNLTLTDVYVTTANEDGDTENGDTQVIVRAEVNGERIEREDDDPIFEFGGERLRVGDEIELESDEYVADGQVTSLDQNGPDLDVETTPILLESTVSANTVDEISEGDTVEAGPHTIGTVQNVQPYPIDGDRFRVHLGVELETLQDGSTPTFAGQSVSVGNGLSLTLDSYSVTGEVLRRGTAEPAGETEHATVELKLEDVDPDVAEGLTEGMTETVRGETLAAIQSVETQPAAVVLESEDGDIHLREHPKNKDVRLTVELRTLETESGIRFHGEALREGDDVVLDLDRTIVSGTVTTLNVDG
ncbi:DUF4330 family protein [Natrialbaceae archaeon A-gly3]